MDKYTVIERVSGKTAIYGYAYKNKGNAQLQSTL